MINATLAERLARVGEAHTGLLRGVVNKLEDVERRLPGPTGSPAFQADGHFLAAVRAERMTGAPDPRLMRAAVSTFGSEGDGAAAGYALPAQHQGVLAAVAAPGSLLDRLQPVMVRSHLVTMAVDESPDWASSPITAGVFAEGEAISASKPALRKVQAVTCKLAALVHLSEELAEDGGEPIYAYVAALLGRRLRAVAENLLIRGDGMGGKPLGVLNAPALVVAAADAGQTAATITKTNIGRMVGRLAPGGLDRAFWAVHSSTLPQLMNLAPLYGDSQPGAPYGTLAGRPVVVSEACNELGSQGDVILVDPAGHLVAVQGPRLAESIAFAFDQHVRSFRATLRLAAAPLLGAAVARRTGTDTVSNLVALAARP